MSWAPCSAAINPVMVAVELVCCMGAILNSLTTLTGKASDFAGVTADGRGKYNCRHDDDDGSWEVHRVWNAGGVKSMVVRTLVC